MRQQKEKRKEKVFVAMSGGVDSSVAALLLKERGYDVVGVFMRCYNIDGCAERDAEDARRVAAKIGIPFYAWDFEEEYKKRVVEYMVRGYRKGITPNPDVMCNKEIKFGLFFKKARKMGADFVATGHYVRSKKSGSRFSLYAAKDKNKDQSYFLWALVQKELAHCLFPIGEYVKPEVREIARKAGLPTAEKKDSQGICFLGQVSLDAFLKQYIPPKPGAIVTTAGKKIGEHEGAYYYTIGQRHGLRVGGGVPYYVTEKNVRKNIVTVAEGSENEALFRKEIELTDVNFVSDFGSRRSKFSVMARVRYRQPLSNATFIPDKKRRAAKLVFAKPQKFVAAGQSAVFYSKSGEMLGGGVIV